MFTNLRVLILTVLVLCLVAWLIQMYVDSIAKKKCTSTAVGHFKYSTFMGGGSARASKYWNPVYEYSTDDSVYLFVLHIEGPRESVFPAEVEVSYDPDDPGTCFALDHRGKILSKYEKETDASATEM